MFLFGVNLPIPIRKNIEKIVDVMNVIKVKLNF